MTFAVFTVGGTVLAFLQFGVAGVVSFVIIVLVLLVVGLSRSLVTERKRTEQLEAPDPEVDGLGEAVDVPPASELTAADGEPQRDVPSDGSIKSEAGSDEEREPILQLIDAAYEGDVARTRELVSAFMATSKNDAQRVDFDAFSQRMLFKAGDTSGLTTLSAIADEHPDRYAPVRHLADLLTELGDRGRAIAELQSRAPSVVEDDRSEAHVKLSGLLLADERPEDAAVSAREALACAEHDSQKSEALRALGSALVKAGDVLPGLGTLEESIRVDPTNRAARGSAAWEYMERGYQQLAITHYEGLLSQHPNNTQYLNNLGVALARLDLNIEAVEEYEKAAERGSALAASNIVYLLIAAGAAKEAKEWVERGEKCGEPDERLAASAARVAELVAKHAKDRASAASHGTSVRDVILRFSGAGSGDATPVGDWLMDDGTALNVSENDKGGFTGTGKAGTQDATLTLGAGTNGVHPASWAVGKYTTASSGDASVRSGEMWIVLRDSPTAGRVTTLHARRPDRMPAELTAFVDVRAEVDPTATSGGYSLPRK